MYVPQTLKKGYAASVASEASDLHYFRRFSSTLGDCKDNKPSLLLRMIAVIGRSVGVRLGLWEVRYGLSGRRHRALLYTSGTIA